MCRIRYDLIGKFESFSEDTRYILIKTGAHDRIDPYDENISWIINRPYSVTTKEAALPYFRSLTKETILKLFVRYEMDFEMFGYSAQEFYDQGRD
jgi:chondroitin 4-sulfotransferase 11